MRILVVGAGPTGLTAALELARRGIEVEIIDQREEGSALSRAVGITPESLALLEPSAVTPRLLDEGIHFRGFCIYRRTEELLRVPFDISSPGHDYNFILGLPQDRTEAILREVLARHGVLVGYGRRLLNLTEQEGRIFADIGDGAQQAFDYVIGADGVHSRCREISGLAFRGYELPETWSIADVDAKNWRHHDMFTVCQAGDGKVAVVAPLAHERYRVISNSENALATLPLPLDVTHIRRKGQFKISIRQVGSYHRGRIFLAGDAAHCHSPVGGRGMNLGIADAVELASRFADGMLDGYDAVRHAAGAKTISGSERARRVMSSENPVVQALFPLVLRTVSHVPALRRRMANTILYG
ncbi:MAG: FAD-dependent monooxygenase [Alphaproteobacteria bacterium]|nr:MAG: FAD-dependent monooxygenase [Alphaproteobacteria bacterium]